MGGAGAFCPIATEFVGCVMPANHRTSCFSSDSVGPLASLKDFPLEKSLGLPEGAFLLKSWEKNTGERD